VTAWRVDAAVAVVAALIILIASPGLAVAGLIAVIVLLLCGASLLAQRLRMRRR
jgi:hypothetical protein